jgi:phosphatidylglycerophosphatase A
MGHASNKQLAERVAALEKPANSWPRWVVTGGGVGFLRPAPGSWGTAVPAVIFFGTLAMGGPAALPVAWGALALFGAIASLLLVMYGKWAAAYFREPDPGPVILDEYAGFAVTVAFVPVPAWCENHQTWGLFVFTAGLYVLFRLTDTLKLPPANYLERLPWGWGILCDDLAAGLQANLLAQAVIWFWMR